MSDQRLTSVMLLLFLYNIVPSSAVTRFPIAKPGCRETCGDVKIPYPFGIGPGCALNKSYTINCVDSSSNSSSNSSSRPHLGPAEVLEISLEDQTVTMNYLVPQLCWNQGRNSSVFNVDGTFLEESPFFISRPGNNLVLIGCGNSLLSPKSGSPVFSGCTSMCSLKSNMMGCYGINCCEASIPFYLTAYQLNFTISEFTNASCASAFLVDQKWDPENYTDLYVRRPALYVPVVWSWTIQSASDVEAISGCRQKRTYFRVESGKNMTNYGCECDVFGDNTWLYEINPYLDGACSYAISKIMGRNKNWTAVIVGATVGAGVLFLMATIFTLYKVVKKRRIKQRQEKFFKRNGGLLLQQQLSADEGVIEKTMLFSAKELNKATDEFNQNRILGQGGQGTVYKGMLTDGRIVAVKKSQKVDENQLEQFINEVVILSQVNHRNVVKLLGCCLETEVPMLVYEFIPNGTLFSLIHNNSYDEFPFTWKMRLRLATEVAGALAYLHSAISIPIFHRDVKSSNILLDEKHIAKVSDFGTSRSVAIDKTHLTTRVQGTFGYLDPEYFQSSQFTEKSDVYSFGVVLVELLTRQKPISSSGTGEDGVLSLATRFLTSMEENSLKTILDPQIVDKRNEKEVIAFAYLARRCLNLNGKRRPTMKEVTTELESIKMSSVQSVIPENFPNPSFNEGESVVFPDTNYTWTSESDSFTIASHSRPLLHDTL